MTQSTYHASLDPGGDLHHAIAVHFPQHLRLPMQLGEEPSVGEGDSNAGDGPERLRRGAQCRTQRHDAGRPGPGRRARQHGVREPLSLTRQEAVRVWKEIGLVGPAQTGFPRNHNPGLLTDTRGYMLSDDEAVIYFTVAMTGENWLWSYDVYSATYDLRSYFKKAR